MEPVTRWEKSTFDICRLAANLHKPSIGRPLSENAPDHAHRFPTEEAENEAVRQAVLDIAEVPAIEVIVEVAVNLMSAAAVKCGLAEGDDADQLKDLDEARKLINALAGLITAAAPDLSDSHARPLRDGLRSLQLAFREASPIPDELGKGPGEKYTGPVS